MDSRGSQKIVAGEPKAVKYHFTHSKRKKQSFCEKFDGKISNFKMQGSARCPFRHTCW